MATVTNNTDRELLALDVEGVDYYSAPGEGLEVAPRTALLLREAGWTMTPAEQRAAIAADDHPSAQPITEDETRFTGGRHHRSDDPRANVPGTPVEVTGDTGSPTNALAAEGVIDSPDVPVVPAAKGRRRRGQTSTEAKPSVEQGNDVTVKTTPQEDDAESLVLPEATDVDVSERALVTPETNPPADPVDPGTLPSSEVVVDPATGQPAQVDHTVATGEQVQASTDAPPAAPSIEAAVPPQGSAEYDEHTTELLDAASALRGAALDAALVQANLDPANKTRDQKTEELRAAILASR